MFGRGLRAIRCRITSVSLVVWKIEPSSSSRARSVVALVRLPLWTMPTGPIEVRTTIGCALAMTDEPAVE